MPSSRNRAWADTLIEELITPGTAIITDLLVGAPTVDTLTAVRIVGEMFCVTQTLSEIEHLETIDMGIGVSSREAFNVGVTGLPDVNNAADYPPRGWLYVARSVVQQSLPTGGTVTAMWRERAHFKFDLRAMRKIDKGVLFAQWASTNVSGTSSSTSLMGRIRVLCLT